MVIFPGLYYIRGCLLVLTFSLLSVLRDWHGGGGDF